MKQPQLRPTSREALQNFPKFVIEDYQTYFSQSIDADSKLHPEKIK
jgi:hypothetical protein